MGNRRCCVMPLLNENIAPASGHHSPDPAHRHAIMVTDITSPTTVLADRAAKQDTNGIVFSES